MTKIAKISMVTNMELQKSKGDDKDISYRKLMNDKADFLKQNEDILQDSVRKFRSMLPQKGYQKRLAQSVNEYLNMDGQQTNQINMGTETNQPAKKPVGFTPNTLLLMGLVLVVAVILIKSEK